MATSPISTIQYGKLTMHFEPITAPEAGAASVYSANFYWRRQ